MGIFRCSKCGHTFESRGDDSKPKRCNGCWSTRVFPIEEGLAESQSSIISAQMNLDSKVQDIYTMLSDEKKINDIILELKVPPRLVVLLAQDFISASSLQEEIDQLQKIKKESTSENSKQLSDKPKRPELVVV